MEKSFTNIHYIQKFLMHAINTSNKELYENYCSPKHKLSSIATERMKLGANFIVTLMPPK